MKVSLTLSLFFRLSDEGHSGHDKFVPEFPEEVMKSLATRGEFFFVIDRSGSMGRMILYKRAKQKRIESAKVRFKDSVQDIFMREYGFIMF